MTAKTPDRKVKADARKEAILRRQSDKEYKAERRARRSHAVAASGASKIRKAVYTEMGYPKDGDPKAEAEIKRRQEKAVGPRAGTLAEADAQEKDVPKDEKLAEMTAFATGADDGEGDGDE